MNHTFNSEEYFNDLAFDIIQNFEKANKATTPVLVGSAKENEVRKKLENIFPTSIGIGTGCIIDTFGHTSKQTDIIIFEKDICPIFSINNTPESTYYPCEGVISVGEVKTTLNTKEPIDSINKIESVKKAKRKNSKKSNWRKYGSRQGILGSESQKFDQINNVSDEIFSFILCEKFGLKPETLLKKYTEILKTKENHLVPNLVISLNDGLILFMDAPSAEIKSSIRDSTSVYLVQTKVNFQYLLTQIDNAIRTGRSVVDLPFGNYISVITHLPSGGLYKNL